MLKIKGGIVVEGKKSKITMLWSRLINLATLLGEYTRIPPCSDLGAFIGYVYGVRSVEI